MEEGIVKALVDQGALGLLALSGWVAAYVLWRRCDANTATLLDLIGKVTEAVASNTAAMIEQRKVIERAVERMEGH